jgi:hypothetical protein
MAYGIEHEQEMSRASCFTKDVKRELRAEGYRHDRRSRFR